MTADQAFGVWLGSKFPDEEERFEPLRYQQAAVFPTSAAAMQAAWEMHIELRTRIATQELPLHSGQEGAALTSLYQLFDRSRALLSKHGPSASAVGSVIMAALNDDLRPFTGYWHGMFDEGALEQPDECGDFRAELREVQDRLRVLADFLGYVACGEAYYPDRLSRTALAKQPKIPPLLATTKVPPLDDELADAEKASRLRRQQCMLSSEEIANAKLAGLALSGGGIRSATFSLGVLTALSRAGLYRHFDYLSTVSGGGFTGTLLSSWATSLAAKLSDSDASKPAEPDPTKRTEPEHEVSLQLRRGPFVDDAVVEHLRDRSRYLVSGGIAGVARAITPLALGILASLSMLLLTTVLTLPAAWLGARVAGAARVHNTVSQILLAAAVASLIVVMRFRKLRKWALRPLAIALVIVAAFAAPAAGIYLVDAVHSALVPLVQKLGKQWSAKALLGVLPVVTTVLGHVLKRRAETRRAARTLLALSPWLVYALALTVLAHALAGNGTSQYVLMRVPDDGALHRWMIAVGAALFVVLFTDVNESSPHGYYRDRLAEAYCVTVDANGRVASSTTPTGIDQLTDLAPIHLINATVNLPATRAANDRGRGAAPFVFSKHGWIYPTAMRETVPAQAHLAAPRLVPKFVRTPTWARVDTATAMAISGAAVSPWMGTSTPDGISPWMTLLNLRLSYWLRNPAKPKPSLAWGFYLLRELIGQVHENGRRINVSDGGHFENLGVYELIRRRCRFIVAIDGEADPELQCSGLMNLVRLARIDFGAEVQIDARKLRLDTDRFSRAHLAVGRIKYHGSPDPGLLLYIKLSVTGDEAAHLLAYRAREPEFPHHSTGDQTFSEEQFESYRALGQHIGEKLFRVELVGKDIADAAAHHAKSDDEPGVDLAAWVTAIERALQRNPHEPFLP